MQPLTAAPREDLTDDQVRALLTGDDITVTAGLELLDTQNRVVADISDDLAAGGVVEHDGRAVVHGVCRLSISRWLAWGRDRVRPYVTLSNDAVTARFNCGVYVLTTPQSRRSDDTPMYDVQGYDLLQLLLDPVGDTYLVVPYPGADLVVNGSVETDTTGIDSNSGFGTYTPATFARTTSKHSGAGVASLEVTWPTAANSWVNWGLSGLIVGKTYLLTCDVWVPAGGPDVRLDILFVASSPWQTTAKDQWVTLDFLWTATTSNVFFGPAVRITTAGMKTWVDRMTFTPLSTTYLDAVKAAISAAGAGAPVRLDGTEHVAVLPSTMVWALTDSNPATWLQIINDLLASINYRELWCDEDGTYRSEPYQDPKTRPVEWTFDTADERTNLVGEESTVDEDVWSAPNHWRFVRRGMDVTPIEGDGIYTVQNLNRGASSQASIKRVRRRVVFLDAANQAALVAQGDRIVIEDTAATRTLTYEIDPLPIVGHLDVVRMIDGDSNDKVEVINSTTSLDGAPGRWVMEVVG
ncbi:hypothetical protein NPS01_25580 [Nocardioides psychrotolerans]|uniref:Minor tail protein n=1 Tax=Nocardioides psychrotolerans TaxID=1005945 RepID=A0A1I3LRZ1_9ACTN|nr:hypothetical protein [Nocardioides psychrotolerans]GEP38895.1 hypothetical protein NPS01_25580 [Nocardioides psychrotolerans]SFI87216.1 hypothetical protein SAMN05216561_11463 [Nocardioides psychrotolerans]